jgi:hypothetical protein
VDTVPDIAPGEGNKRKIEIYVCEVTVNNSMFLANGRLFRDLKTHIAISDINWYSVVQSPGHTI